MVKATCDPCAHAQYIHPRDLCIAIIQGSQSYVAVEEARTRHQSFKCSKLFNFFYFILYIFGRVFSNPDTLCKRDRCLYMFNDSAGWARAVSDAVTICGGPSKKDVLRSHVPCIYTVRTVSYPVSSFPVLPFFQRQAPFLGTRIHVT